MGPSGSLLHYILYVFMSLSQGLVYSGAGTTFKLGSKLFYRIKVTKRYASVVSRRH